MSIDFSFFFSKFRELAISKTIRFDTPAVWGAEKAHKTLACTTLSVTPVTGLPGRTGKQMSDCGVTRDSGSLARGL